MVIFQFIYKNFILQIFKNNNNNNKYIYIILIKNNNLIINVNN